MNEKGRQRLAAAARPYMAPDERFELITLAKVGSIKKAMTKSVAVSAAAAVVVGALGGGGGFVAYAQKPVWVILTDRQLLIFLAPQSIGGKGKHLVSFQRDQLTCGEPRPFLFGLWVRLTLNAEGPGRPLRLVFPPIPPHLRVDARELAAALNQHAPAMHPRDSQHRGRV